MSASGKLPTLYVFPGSHACRTGMLMLEHKGIDYRCVNLQSGLHPFSVRLRGFPGNRSPIREVDGQTHGLLALLDRLGTVPALRFADEHVQSNHAIARFLDRLQPEPPLFPDDPERRAEVQEAEKWGNDVLQMAARRIVLAASAHGLDALHNRGASGRLGPLLSPHDRVRAFASRGARTIFRASPEREDDLLARLPGMLDRIDVWIADGVLNGERLNAADYMIAPSVALLTYCPSLRESIASRPTGALVDRVLAEPSSVTS